MDPDEAAFVVSGWSASYRTAHQAGLIADGEWAVVMHRQINRIITHPTTRVLVAAARPGQSGHLDHLGRPFLYGFVALREPRAGVRPYVYYLYVKTAYRRARSRHGAAAGYATQLLAAADVDPHRPFGYACRTHVVSLLGDLIPFAELDPQPARCLR
jgi:hypothetical protein